MEPDVDCRMALIVTVREMTTDLQTVLQLLQVITSR